MPSIDVIGGAVLDDLTAAIDTAWSPVKIYVKPFDMPETYSGGYPVVWIDPNLQNWQPETPVTVTTQLTFTITGVFDNDVTDGNFRAMLARVANVQAELYGVLNMGTYGYLGEISDVQLIPFEGNNRFGVGLVYTCEVSFDRT